VDRQVEAAGDHVHRCMRHQQLDAELRVASEQVSEPREQLRRRRRRGHRHPHRPDELVLAWPQLLLDPVQVLQHAAHAKVEPAPFVGDRHRAGRALEEAGAEALLEQGDALAHGVRGEAEDASRAREASAIDGEDEGAQRGEVVDHRLILTRPVKQPSVIHPGDITGSNLHSPQTRSKEAT
jgi:hypothetical protein